MFQNHKNKIYFISGTSGVGKSSTLEHLKSLLPSDKYDIRDLDERGVPDGGGLEWLNNETRHWLDIAKQNALSGRSTIICGFANPELFKNVYKPDNDMSAKIILLNASSEQLEKRLRKRHSTPESIKEIERASGIPVEQFIKDNLEFAPKLYDIFKKSGHPIIETDDKTPLEVAELIVKLLD